MIRHHLAVWRTGPKVGVVRDVALGVLAFVIAVRGAAADPAVMVGVLGVLWAAGRIVTTTLLPTRPACRRRARRPRGLSAPPPALLRGHRAPRRPLGWRRRGAHQTGRPAPGGRAGLPTPAAVPPGGLTAVPAAAGQTPARGHVGKPIQFSPGRAAVGGVR
jgi:hypothetical protein